MTDTTDRFRKRPIPVTARQLNADSFRAILDALAPEQFAAGGENTDGTVFLEVRSLEGVMHASEGDWIVWDRHGHVWVVRGSVFAETYEPVPAEEAEAASAVVPAADRAAPVGPVCKFEEGCHRVVACDPGCGAAAAGRAALRDRIAEALLDHLSRTADIRPGKDGELAFMPEVTDPERTRIADVVLSVLPAPADRAAVLTEAADKIDAGWFTTAASATAELRRLAVESAVVDRVAAETPPAETTPRRGDAFEQWLKAQRDLCLGHATSWGAVDGLLDQYRLHADMGVPLDGHVCEARVVGDCECLESGPAVEAQPGKDTETPQPKEA